MIYVTKRNMSGNQITIEDVLEGNFETTNFDFRKQPTGTITRRYEDIPYTNQLDLYITGLIQKLMNFNELYRFLFPITREKYREFYIKKRSGGRRRISEPNEALKRAQYHLKDIFEKDFDALYHTNAFAYIKGRCTKDALKLHQYNESQWYLKTDYSNFFGSINKEFTMKMLSMIYPFNFVVMREVGKYTLSKALDVCFLEDSLPQGTPISPMLTNLIMIPIDHALANSDRKHMVYTRYADDMMISSRVDFSWKDEVSKINAIAKSFDAPFVIKTEKTRYGSRAGSNWNLGLMINKDNNITVGHLNKKEFKAMLSHYALDKLSHENWPKEDVLRLNGLISYYGDVEKEYIGYVIRHISRKYKLNIIRAIEKDLKK